MTLDDNAAGLILLIARRLALDLVFSFMCAGAVLSASAVAAAVVAATPPASAAVVASAAAGQDASAVEASLGLDRPARRLIQRGLNNEGFDAGAPDGLFGPRTRVAIRRRQEARGLPATGYLDSWQAELLRAAAMPAVAARQRSKPSCRPAPIANADGQTALDLAQENEWLQGSDVYWRMNDARFNALPT